MNTAPLTITLDSPAVKAEFMAIPYPIRMHLVEVIRREAPNAGRKPLVLGWTCDGNRAHIFRVIKDYVYRPGHRIIFHRSATGIVIDRVAARDCDPYQDGK